jgi:hypothetical protein
MCFMHSHAHVCTWCAVTGSRPWQHLLNLYAATECAPVERVLLRSTTTAQANALKSLPTPS